MSRLQKQPSEQSHHAQAVTRLATPPRNRAAPRIERIPCLRGCCVCLADTLLCEPYDISLMNCDCTLLRSSRRVAVGACFSTPTGTSEATCQLYRKRWRDIAALVAPGALKRTPTEIISSI